MNYIQQKINPLKMTPCFIPLEACCLVTTVKLTGIGATWLQTFTTLIYVVHVHGE